MNRIFLVLILVFASSFARQPEQIHLAPVIAYGNTLDRPYPDLLPASNALKNSERTFKPSYAIGIKANYLWRRHWSVSASLTYAHEGRNILYKDARLDFNDNAYANYLRLPLALSFYFRDPSDRIRPYIFSGLSLGFLLNQGVDIKPNNDYSNAYLSNNPIVTPVYKRWDLGMDVGIGLDYKCNYRKALFIECKYYRGLLSPYETSP